MNEKLFSILRGGVRFRLLIAMVLLLCGGVALKSQSYTDTLSVYFHQGRSTFDSSYRGNGERADSFVRYIHDVLVGHEDATVKGIRFEVSCSPEGSRKVNERLVAARAEGIMKWMRPRLPLENIPYTIDTTLEPWTELLPMVESDENVPYREEVIELIKGLVEGRSQKSDLEALRGGEPWRYMLNKQFPSLRRFEMSVEVEVHLPELEIDEEVLRKECERTQLPMTVPLESMPIFDTGLVSVSPLTYKAPKDISVYVKTNGIALGMLVGNVCVEVRLPDSPWSVNVPVYYSGLNWFRATTKFKMAAFLPELRYNFAGVEGLYAGVHGGVAWYNFAFSGDWRIQDAGGKSPALGGGVSLGYRITPFKRVPALGVEFNAGLGVYSVKYDKFYNEPNGPAAEKGVSAVKCIPDALGISLYYRFDNVKGGTRR